MTLFFMEIKIFTTNGCGYCSKMKELMDRTGLEYKEYRLGRTLTIEEYHKYFPDHSSFPRLVIDEQPIGDLVEAVRYFVERGMISTKKK